MQALANSAVSPSRVCLEITETVLMHDSAANLELLHKMRDLGLQISLDDFGTGYSSLNYLRSFPFDKIKIDRCFISEIEENADCQAIVKSVIALADSLGMTTIAEGVERTSQADLLQREGCAELQGFLFSKALPVEQLLEYFRTARKAEAA
jgi:EAL domain-containing protein (putative c-di-GMP-specific phosphodiesterase class I)